MFALEIITNLNWCIQSHGLQSRKISCRSAGKNTYRHVCAATEIENIHAGKSPVTKTGDYSDVKVIDAEGREIPWNEVSRISNDEMKGLMKQVVNRLYTFFIQGEDTRFQKQAEYFERVSEAWDAPEPQIDPSLDCSKKPQTLAE